MKHHDNDTQKTAFSVFFYMVTAIAMVLVNKAVLNTIDLPITFLTLQIVVAVLLLLTSHQTKLIKLPKMDVVTSWKLLPLVLINVLGLTMNTLCLKYVDASFYQVARSLVLPITVILTWIQLKKASSPAVLFACGLVCFGFYVGTMYDSTVMQSFSIAKRDVVRSGIGYGIISSITTAIHAVTIKKSLVIVNGNTIELVYYSNLLSIVGLIPVIFFKGEISSLVRLISSAAIESGYAGNAVLVSLENILEDEGAGTFSVSGATNLTLGSMNTLQIFLIGGIITGIIGFLLNLAGVLQIKVTSPVTHMISSAVRGVIQTLLAILFFGDLVSTARISSIFFILAGSFIYSLARSRENRAEQSYQLPSYHQPKEGKDYWACQTIYNLFDASEIEMLESVSQRAFKALFSSYRHNKRPIYYSYSSHKFNRFEYFLLGALTILSFLCVFTRYTVSAFDSIASSSASSSHRPSQGVSCTIGSPPQQSNNAYATLCVGDSFVFGSLVLFHSLKETGSKADLVAMVYNMSEPNIALLNQFGGGYNLITIVRTFIITNLKIQLYRATSSGSIGHRDEILWSKLRVWQLEDYDKIVMLDTDLLVLQNCDELFTYPEFAACPMIDKREKINFWQSPEMGMIVRNKNSKPLVNWSGLNRFGVKYLNSSGVTVLVPSNVTFTALVTEISILPNRPCCPSQEFLYIFFETRKRYIRLPSVYNARLINEVGATADQQPWAEHIKIYHFVGTKPWKKKDHSFFNKLWWIRGNQVIQLVESLKESGKASDSKSGKASDSKSGKASGAKSTIDINKDIW